MKMYSRVERPDKAEFREYNSGHRVTETAGYVPASVLVSQMIRAGVKLREYREDQFHFGADEEVPQDFLDPTLDPDFDLKMATEAFDDAGKRLQAAREAEEAKREEEAVEKDPDPDPPEAA